MQLGNRGDSRDPRKRRGTEQLEEVAARVSGHSPRRSDPVATLSLWVTCEAGRLWERP